MFGGFQKIIEDRIRKAQKKGEFENLKGAGEPLILEDDSFVPEDLRLAFKILKNADCVPPEIEIKKEIGCLEKMLADAEGAGEKYRVLKKLNYLIMKLNMSRNTSVGAEVPQRYEAKLVDHLEAGDRPKKE